MSSNNEIMISKQIFINTAYESDGESPLPTTFRCCLTPLIGLLNIQKLCQATTEKRTQ